MFSEVQIEPQEFINSGEEVLVVIRGRGVGRVSGVAIDQHFCHVWTFENAEALQLRVYSDRDKALEAVGRQE